MDSVWLTETEAQIIMQHALAATPEECCGLLVGYDQTVQRVIAIQNVSANPKTHYLMDQGELARYLPEINGQGLDVVGFYHSHPNGHPVFSETDRRESLWDNRIHLIIGLKRNPPHFAAWKTSKGQVIPVAIQIQKRTTTQHRTLSKSQKVAIIISGMIAFVAMQAASFHLLPPAPPIP
jgi:desampylase